MTSEVEGSLKDLDLSQDEIKRFKTAFEDPEFRRLFSEYANELSDPVNKQKYEEEIIEMERERGVDAILINPNPQYVLKTRLWMPDGQEQCKLFINVASSEKIGEPSMEKCKGGYQWSLPHCYHSPRDDFDKTKQVAKVIDVVFHPKVFQLSQQNVKMMDCVNCTALEGVMSQFKLGNIGLTKDIADRLLSAQGDKSQLLLSSFHILKGVKYKGLPKPTILRKDREDAAEIKRDREERDAKDLTEAPHLEPLIRQQKQPEKPLYEIIQGQNSDLSINKGPISHEPDYLRVIIHLPSVRSTQQFDLDVTSRRLLLTSDLYHLDLNLPREVDETKCEAKFDRDMHQCTVTAPIVKNLSTPPVNIKQGPCRLIEELASPTLSSSSSSGKFSICPSPVQKCMVQPIQTGVKMTQVPVGQLSVPKTHKLMAAKFRQDPSSFTVMLGVRHVLPASLQINWAGSETDVVQMVILAQNRSSGGCTMDWGLALKCPLVADELTPSYDEDDSEQISMPQMAMIASPAPELLTWSVNEQNIVLVVRKPRSEWWSAIATGRTLDAGLEVAEFHGVQHPASLATSPKPVNSPSMELTLVRGMQELTLLATGQETPVERQTSLESSSASTASITKSILKRRTQSESSCEDLLIMPSMQHTRSCLHNPQHQHRCLLHLQHRQSLQVVQPLTPSCECHMRTETAHFFQQHDDEDQLSQFSSSSFSSLEFSDSEQQQQQQQKTEAGKSPRRRVHSICVDGLPSTRKGGCEEETPVSPPVRCLCRCGHRDFLCSHVRMHATRSASILRQQRSVNFSRKNDSLDFCPHESVDALHHSLMNKRKKARKFERRRHNSESNATDEQPNKNPRKKRNQKKGNKYQHQQQQLSLVGHEPTEPIVSGKLAVSSPVNLTADVIFELDEN